MGRISTLRSTGVHTGAEEPELAAPVIRSPARRRQRSGPGPADLAYWGASAVILLWALFLNCFRLGTPDIQTDEPTYAKAAWRYVHGRVGPPLGGTRAFNSANFQHPPLAKWFFGLAQLAAGHESVLADRVVAAAATVLTGTVLAVWVGRAAGRWAGLLAGALVVLLPEAAQTTNLRFGRYGELDPVAELFVAVYLLLMWEWFSRRGRRAWLFAVASGIAIGAAGASKENGFLAAVVPVLVCILASWREPVQLARRLGQASLAILASLVTLLVTYAPFGSPLQRIRYLIAFQTAHSSDGHLAGFAGRVSWHPPWWANLWFAAHSMGAGVTIFVLASVALACVLRRDRLVGFCLAALAGPVIFHCFIARVAQPHYWTLWGPPLFALAAIGAGEAARRLRAMALPAPLKVGAVALALLTPVLASASLTRRTATITSYGPEVLGSVLAQHRLTGPVLASGLYSYQFRYYLPKVPVLMTPPASLVSVETVLIGAPQCRLETDNRTTRGIVAVNLAAGRLRRIHTDPAMTVYAVTGRLVTPSPAQIAAQPPTNLAAGC